jgi:hypothetical protein
MADAETLSALDREFGCRPDEANGERWAIYNRHLIVIHPDRRPRIFKPGCGGSYYELEPTFP